VDTRDPAFERLLSQARRAAGARAAILIAGQSGTGRGYLARRIHAWSPRADGPFVEVACANLPVELAESELFGHERGAFTDARETREGRFEVARGGTLYFRGIEELAPEIQAKVLRVLQESRFERLGGRTTIEADARILASTAERPERLVERGALRPDLYFRLNVVRLDLPPLHERAADIPALAEEFLAEACRHHGVGPRALTPDALARLKSFPWPGNLVELRNAIESAAVLSEGPWIDTADLPPSLGADAPGALAGAARDGRTLKEVEDAYIREVLARAAGNVSAAARILGIHRKTLHEKLRPRPAGKGS